MANWFEGTIDIPASLDHIEQSTTDLAVHFVSVNSRMPGLTSVDIIQQEPTRVVLDTNEGRMTRSALSRELAEDRLTLSFNEEYRAGKLITAWSCYTLTFFRIDTGVRLHLIISDVKTTGVLGFFYRNFAKTNIGKATLKAYSIALTS